MNSEEQMRGTDFLREQARIAEQDGLPNTAVSFDIIANYIEKLEEEREDLIYYHNMWLMALELVGLPEDASGGAFRDKIKTYNKFKAFWAYAREVDKLQFLEYEWKNG